MIRKSLYLRIYLTVLGSLALVALVLMSLAFLGRFDTDGSSAQGLGRFASSMFDGLDLEERQDMINRLARGLDADIRILNSDGRVVQRATSGDEDDDSFSIKSFHFPITGGEVVEADINRSFGEHRRNLIVTILVIVVLTGVAALPVVKHLTRRLDSLRRGAEAWGKGDLGARVPVNGCDEITTVADAFNRAASQIEKLVNSQRSLLANASHELRSPLARLRMAIEMFELNQSDKLRKEIVNNLLELDELVDEILIKSRLGSDQPFDLTQYVDLQGLVVEEGSAVCAEVHGGKAAVCGSERLLRRMVRNLLQNAARHGKPPIEVEIKDLGGRISISVTDHGEGLKEHEAIRIFEPFYRPEGRSEADGGWGLGLSLVAEIARLHGGHAGYCRPDQGGACFFVEIATKPPGSSGA